MGILLLITYGAGSLLSGPPLFSFLKSYLSWKNPFILAPLFWIVGGGFWTTKNGAEFNSDTTLLVLYALSSEELVLPDKLSP
jgi:hypothetical protein